MLAAYNDLGSVETLFQQADGQVAAVIVEAVGANMGVVPPREGFLQGLRALCDQYHALLIFDEVITGFRLAFGGAAQYFGVTPDLVTYGKIIGAGMPVGAYGGRRDVMELVAPAGKVYQAGTLSGNPVAMAAGLTQLKYLYDHQEIYTELEKKGELLYGGMGKIVKEKGLMFVGLDLIGGRITEINVTSPTCVREIDDQCGTDIATDFIIAIEKKLSV